MSPRIPALSRDTAPPESIAILDATQRALGMIPNLHRTLAHAPPALAAYASLAAALAKGQLDPKLRESVALATAGFNGCAYCASAHTALGRGVGVAADELTANLDGRSTDPRVSAALEFVGAVLERRGDVDDRAVERVRAAGFDDAQIVELVAHVGMNTFTNLFNVFARTDIDFPRVDVIRSRQHTVATSSSKEIAR
ncbi:MAG: carboxymuconolactone decarboxylase family protein [Planctomycetota bacterium]